MKEYLSKFIDYLPNKVFGTETENSDIETFMRNITKIAVAVFSAAVIIFVVALIPALLSEDVAIEGLGPVGDFFGGLLNPVFAFLGLMALLYTLRLNQIELNQATEQMSKSAEAAQQSIILQETQFLLSEATKNLNNLLDIDATGNNETKAFGDFILNVKIDFTNVSSHILMKSGFHVISDVSVELASITRLSRELEQETNSRKTSDYYFSKFGIYILPLLKTNLPINTYITTHLQIY